MTDFHRKDGPQRLELDLPAAHSAGRMARRMAREFALAEGLPEDEVETLEFVTGELLDNAIDHGGGGGALEVDDLPRDVRMRLDLKIAGGGWTVTVGDQGGGDPSAVRDLIEPPDGFPDLEDERGRGFFLLASMVDELTVDPTPSGDGLAFRARRRFGG